MVFHAPECITCGKPTFRRAARVCPAAGFHPADARRDEPHAIDPLDVCFDGTGLSVPSEDIWPMGDFERPSGGGDAAPCCQGQREKGSEYRRAGSADTMVTSRLRPTGTSLLALWIRSKAGFLVQNRCKIFPTLKATRPTFSRSIWEVGYDS